MAAVLCEHEAIASGREELCSFGCGRSLASFWWDEEGPVSMEARRSAVCKGEDTPSVFPFGAADSESRQDSEDDLWEK